MGGISMKKLVLSTAIITFAFLSTNSNAAPVGGTVDAGKAIITRNDKTLIDGKLTDTTITQSTKFAKINWTDFSSAKGESIQFVQPNSNAVTINKVSSGQQSMLMGELSANGRVVIMNDAGITFGAGSKVNVQSLYATTAKVATNKLGNERDFIFSKGTAPITNDGTISVGEGGTVAFLAPQVDNHGTINAPKGRVFLYGSEGGEIVMGSQSGDTISDNPDVKIQDGKSTVNQEISVENTGNINSKSGRVDIKTIEKNNDKAADFINLAGVVDATKMQVNDKGSVIIVESRGNLTVDGRLKADALNSGSGGTIDLKSNGVVKVTSKSALSANGGTKTPSSSTSDNSGGTINITKIGKLSDKGDTVVIEGDIYAKGGKDSKNNSGKVDIKTSGSGKLKIASSSDISTSADTSGGNGGSISITGENNDVTVDGNLLADGEGVGNGGHISIDADSTSKSKTVDLTSGHIFARGGKNDGHGGDLLVKSDKSKGDFTTANINLDNRDSKSGKSGEFDLNQGTGNEKVNLEQPHTTEPSQDNTSLNNYTAHKTKI